MRIFKRFFLVFLLFFAFIYVTARPLKLDIKTTFGEKVKLQYLKAGLIANMKYFKVFKKVEFREHYAVWLTDYYETSSLKNKTIHVKIIISKPSFFRRSRKKILATIPFSLSINFKAIEANSNKEIKDLYIKTYDKMEQIGGKLEMALKNIIKILNIEPATKIALSATFTFLTPIIKNLFQKYRQKFTPRLIDVAVYNYGGYLIHQKLRKIFNR